MHAIRATVRSTRFTRAYLDCYRGPPNFSHSARNAGDSIMFKKAVKEQVVSKPLQSSLLNANSVSSNLPPTQTVGIKRKIEINNGGSALGSLHNAVYFDENDFDDDLDLDIDEPMAFTYPAPTTSSSSVVKPDPISYPVIDLTDTKPSDITYPELPPVPLEIAPPSSIPIPWSSSPPSHRLPPKPQPKPRNLPWAIEEKKEPIQEKKINTVTPKRPRPSDLWNKTESAIKEGQRELRQEYKTQKGGAPVKVTGEERVLLSNEQNHVLDMVVDSGKSIFFTGSAGTGKSVLMREIIKRLRKKFHREPDRVAVTASTGLAACNIEGITLHSFAGIGLGKESVQELVKKIKKNQKSRNRWLRTKVLVIDEVSMVDGDLFDKLEEIARRIRNNGRAFGGIQLVVTGDFFQLPPVPERNSVAKFSFDATSWPTSIHHTILLTHVFRQRDPEFAGMLNDLRLGICSAKTNETFRSLSRPLNFHDELEATELFPTRNEVENANSARMKRLGGEMLTFHAVDSGTADPNRRENLLSHCMAPTAISLKKGAQVMLIKNMEETLVNGSIGRVIAFMDESTFDYHKIKDENPSNDTDSDGDNSTERARKKIKAMAHNPGGVTVTKKWPLVLFVQPDGTERQLLCQPEAWKIELPNGEVQAQRLQVPLILAWALSIHKAQGQTLQRVKVNLGRTFEKGQAYVALSRATSKDGLQVLGFDSRKVMVHPRVIEFYNKLVSITQVLKPKKTKQPTEDFDDEFFD